MTDSAQYCVAVAQLEAALAGIEEIEKTDYVEALKVAPQLVKTESDPERFLRFTNFNAAAAAQSLVNYWKRRRDTFQERAFLPLSITGYGALSQEAIQIYKSGLAVHLPNDAQGCAVVCFDPTRRPLDCSPRARKEVLFYNGHRLSENPQSQTEGFSALILMNEFRYDPTSQESINILFNCFPIKIRCWHLFNCIPPSETNWLVQKFMRGLELLFGHVLRNNWTYFYTSQSEDCSFVETLESHGIAVDGIPRCLGGNWSYARHSVQTKERSKTELQLHFPTKLEEILRKQGVAALPPSNIIHSQLESDCAVQEEKASHKQGSAMRKEKTTAVGLFKQSEDGVQPAGITHTSGSNIPPTLDSLGVDWDWYVERAFESEIPQERMACYFQARKEAPREIWQGECQLETFLRIEDFHPRKAANRMLRYWDLRKETFGAPACFRQMHQTGEGALNRTDLRVLGTGFLMLLPDDESGCPVLWIDGGKLSNRRSMPDDVRDRCFFYMFSLLAEHGKSQSNGAVILFYIDSPAFRRIDTLQLLRMIQILPLRLKALHLLSHEPVPTSVEEQLQPFGKLNVHDGLLPEKMVAVLEKDHGIKKSGLPKKVNGDLGLEQFLEWQEARTRVEFRLPLNNLGEAWIRLGPVPGLTAYEEIPLAEKVERRRRLNVINCRRKRDYKRIQIELLHEDIAKLTNKQRGLRAESATLEKALTAAKKVTTFFAQGVEESTLGQEDSNVIQNALSEDLIGAELNDESDCESAVFQEKCRSLSFPSARNEYRGASKQSAVEEPKGVSEVGVDESPLSRATPDVAAAAALLGILESKTETLSSRVPSLISAATALLEFSSAPSKPSNSARSEHQDPD